AAVAFWHVGWQGRPSVCSRTLVRPPRWTQRAYPTTMVHSPLSLAVGKAHGGRGTTASPCGRGWQTDHDGEVCHAQYADCSGHRLRGSSATANPLMVLVSAGARVMVRPATAVSASGLRGEGSEPGDRPDP